MDGLITICAWCNRQKRDGKWVVVTSADIYSWQATHGICERCSDKLEAEMDENENQGRTK